MIMPSLKWLRSRINGIRQARAKPIAFVQWDANGLNLTVQKGGRELQNLRLAWDRVTGVFAYKRDCFTIDQICLAIGSDELEQWIEVTEDDAGYKKLLEQLPTHLAGFPTRDEWWQSVALPPFKTQRTQLYGRKTSEGRR